MRSTGMAGGYSWQKRRTSVSHVHYRRKGGRCPLGPSWPWLALWLVLLPRSVHGWAFLWRQSSPSLSAPAAGTLAPLASVNGLHSSRSNNINGSPSSSPDKVNGNNKLPFIVEMVPAQVNPSIFQEISSMCIQAFFNDGEAGRQVAPWKSWQLSYLQQLQQADLSRRQQRNRDTNMMFVARQVVPAEPTRVLRSTPLVLDLSVVHNLDRCQGQDWVRGDLLGFVEVTQKPYGLGNEKIGFDEESKIHLRKSTFYQKRPVLTNLSVRFDARKSGVGSKLLEMAEQQVLRQWNMPEIILEVEDDNWNALAFYERRGYRVLFEDPASRRYDVNGLWLQQKRCNRRIMRKALTPSLMKNHSDSVATSEWPQSTLQFGVKVLQKLRENVFSATTTM